MRLTAVWASLLVVGAAALLGPVTALADDKGGHKPKPSKDPDAAIVYEVAEWGMFVPRKEPRRRQATATLVGTVEVGATICPKKLEVPFCDLVILASDDISLITGRGPVEGDFWVVVQLELNSVDGPEGIILEGKLFDATIDLGPALFQQVPIGFLSGQWEAKGTKGGPLDGWKGNGEVRGTFQLPFEVKDLFPPSYMVDPALFPEPACCEPVLPAETSLGVPTVRLELSLTLGK
jgi:hypothetical protein